MNLPTASSLPRVVACPASHVLPHAPSEDSPAAAAGRERHARIADVLAGRAARESIPWDVREILGITDGDAVAVERAYRLRLDDGSVTVLGDELGRAYPKREPGAIDGTADVVVRHATGRTALVDWKGRSGAQPVRENWQLRTLAAMARANVVAIVALDGEEFQIDAAAFTVADHEKTLDVLRLTARIIGAHRDRITLGPLGVEHVHPGDHCRYCPARPHCPAYGEEARSLATIADAQPATLDRLRAEIAAAPGDWYVRAGRMREITDAVWSMLDSHARTVEPITLPDGRTARRVDEERRSIDGCRALPVLHDAGLDAAITQETSFAAITRAWKAAHPTANRGEHAHALAAIEESLASVGAIKTGTRPAWRVK